MWLSHYGYHLLTSFETAIPTTQRFAADLGWTALGKPAWICSCCRQVGEWLPHLEILCLDLGLLLSLYTGYRISLAEFSRPGRALRAFWPWAILLALLFTTGTWIVLQPMQMRGTMPLGN